MDAKPPLMLLHGVMMSGAVWGRVVPLLEDAFTVYVPTLAGHRGGTVLPGRATVEALVDDVERQLDTLEVENAHFAGSSLGGWVALELARRGRARSVCALSPAGFWTAGSPDQTSSVRRLHLVRTLTRASAPISGFMVRSALVRRLVMRDIAHRGDRSTRDEAVTASRDLLGCASALDLLDTPEQLAPLDPIPCPVTLGWPVEDRVFSAATHGVTARARVPGAEHVELPGTGHVPMIDDPELCARVIRTAAGSPLPIS